jgi:hypothetical protein
MASSALYPALLATATLLIGPGSMALHASMTDWGGQVDGASMDLFIHFGIAFGLSRRLGWGERGFAACYAVLFTLGVWRSWVVPAGWREAAFGALLAAVLLLEGLPDPRLHDRRWLWASCGLLAAAFLFWALSRTGASPLCDPRSLLQGHAAWHVLCAAAAGTLYLHYRSEPAGQRAG